MKYNCINCGDIDKRSVAEELYGDRSWTYCDTCYEGVDPVYEPQPPRAAIQRPKRFCFFIKPKDDHPEKYTRFEEFFLALRIGYFKEAIRLLCGKRSNYIWEGLEQNPMPF